MTINQPSPREKKFRFTWVLVGIVALGIILAASGFTFAASQETHDPFCASCHTQPETTFFQRSTAAQAVDLASFHTAQQTRCIDCHSGAGVLGRMRAELLGARNAAAWYTHTDVQPAKLTVPIRDANGDHYRRPARRGGGRLQSLARVLGALAGCHRQCRHLHQLPSRTYDRRHRPNRIRECPDHA
jgi:hypothetical protein